MSDVAFRIPPFPWQLPGVSPGFCLVLPTAPGNFHGFPQGGTRAKPGFPLGKTRGSQDLIVLTKLEDGSLKKRFISAVVFVPMTGEIRR